jgi:RNA polymerase sigma-70 factor (ECF subfamily)
MELTTYDSPCDASGAPADAELVERVRDDDRDAFNMLVCRYSQQFFRMAQGIVEDESEAEDVLQKAFLKMHDKIDSLRDPSSFSSWAYRIVRNQALMRVRKRNRNQEVGFGDLGPGRDDERHWESDGPNWRYRADDAAENQELRERLDEAVQELEPKYQSPFVLYEVEGMELDDIADLLDLSTAGVKTRIHRARKTLRATLGRYVDDGEVLNA